MHLSIFMMALALALGVRLCWFRSNEHYKRHWSHRWQYTLGVFLFPPLFLIVTSLTVLGMGHHGTMLWRPVGWLGCHIALGFLMMAGALMLHRLWQEWRSLHRLHAYPLITVAGKTGRLLDVPALFAAQVGVWKPELVISQGLLQSLEAEQIEAVLQHEEAHAHYRDTFWFFWLGWIRQLTFWLPNTEALWQELLLLRELRADRWAAQHGDALVLAESLLRVVRSPLIKTHGVAFHDATPIRLEERIEALLSGQTVDDESGWFSWAWFLPALLPLLTLPLHGHPF